MSWNQVKKLIYICTKIKGPYAPFLQFIISKLCDPHRKEMHVLKFLAFLPLYNTSCPFLSFPALFYPFQIFGGWVDGRTGLHGLTDIRTDGRN